MNETDEEHTVLPLSSGKLLAGNSLLQLHVTVGKNLPKDGSKDFNPTNSWMEKKQIQSALDERHELLNEERVEKWGCLAGAIWDSKKKLAEVTRRIGKIFQTLGFEKNGTLYLYPEEALYLLEVNSIELTFGGVPVSLQQGYSLLLGLNTGCSLIEYRAYSHLLRQGYKLLRFTSQKAYTEYERVIRLNQHVPAKRNHPGANTHSSSKSLSILGNFPLKNEDGSSRDSACRKVNDITFIEESDACMSSINKDLSVSDFSHRCVSGSSGALLSVTNLKDERRDSLGRASQSTKSRISLEQPTDDCAQPNQLNESSTNSCGETCVDSDGLKEELKRDQVPDNIHIQSTEKSSASHGSEMSTNILAPPYITGDSMNEMQNQHSQDKSQFRSKSASIQESGKSSSVEGAETRAYGIAKQLISLGNVLVEKNSSGHGDDVNMSEDETLSDSLQSEIIRVLGSQLDTGVSKESLATVAASAASTILSHISSGKGNGDQNADCKPHDKTEASNDEPLQVLDSIHESNESHVDESNVREPESDLDLAGLRSTKVALDIILDSEDTGDTCNQTITSITDNHDLENGEASQSLKRQVPSCTEIDECEPVLIKRAKVTDTCESEIEILDFIPEEKQVELVNLSDESSMYSSESSEEVATDNGGIEVIDVVSNSSSSDCSDTGSSSSESDGLAILEVKNDSNWEQERRHILETIPNMYSLAEITVVPPSSDLLPSNVQPQRNKYIINRFRLLKEGKGSDSRPQCPPNQHSMKSRPITDFGSREHMPSSAWPPNPSINPMALQAVQAIAQLVLPMLGLPSNAFPSEQMWLPASNPWFQPRPSWGFGPRFNQHSRGMNWQRSRPRTYGYRQFSPRYQHHQRGLNYTSSFSANRPLWNCSSAVAHEYPQNNELIPFQSSSHEDTTASAVQESGQWCAWKQKNLPNQRCKARRCSKGPRYFRPPKKWTHMHKLLEDNNVSPTVKADCTFAEERKHTPSRKSESESSDEGSKSGISSLHTDGSSGDSENTSGSEDSAMEVKPLLSPHDCISFDSVFKAVQVIKEADRKTLVSHIYQHCLKPQYDLFSPTKPFKKGNPPVPDFHLCILKPDDVVPTPGETQSLLDIFDDGVPLLFAIVSPDSVSFIQFNGVSLPMPSRHL